MTRHLRGCPCETCDLERYAEQVALIDAIQNEPPAPVVRATMGNVTPLDPITRAHWKYPPDHRKAAG